LPQSREEKLAKQRAYNNSPAGKASSAKYRAKPEAKVRRAANSKRWADANPDRIRAACRRHRGIVNPSGERRIGTCPICQRPDRVLCLDHEYTTGQPRGWLCVPCNTFLGQTAQDAETRVTRAQAYLAGTL
jgi:hypothetical protein